MVSDCAFVAPSFPSKERAGSRRKDLGRLPGNFEHDVGKRHLMLQFGFWQMEDTMICRKRMLAWLKDQRWHHMVSIDELFGKSTTRRGSKKRLRYK
ncbi:hypothetical protein IAQ61_002393 [Plenodomus lingam]|uniref:uncharacterized protein n=1 Tax=Leptosphaeria maculans TaxID=5022 RepID=UPI00331FF77C|nr:hypothetical protein IAQ61_002393 [Plenodomus lingam]